MPPAGSEGPHNLPSGNTGQVWLLRSAAPRYDRSRGRSFGTGRCERRAARPAHRLDAHQEACIAVMLGGRAILSLDIPSSSAHTDAGTLFPAGAARAPYLTWRAE